MKIFNSVAQMKLATIKAGQYVETFGYYTKGDAGAARYLVVAAQVADEKGDHTLANGTVAALQAGKSVNINQFGAQEDGSDVVTYAQAAINYAFDKNISAVFAKGKFSYKSQLLIKQGVQYNGGGYKFGPRYWGGGLFTGWQYTENGSIISVEWGSGAGTSDDYTKATILLQSGASIVGFAAYYPNQDMTQATPTEYGALIAPEFRAGSGVTDAATEDCLIQYMNFGNSYVGVDARRDSSQIKVLDCNGFPLFRGIRLGSTVDNDLIQNIHFARLNALRGTITPYEPLLNFVNTQAKGVEIGKSSWGNFNNIFCFGYRNTIYGYYQDGAADPEVSRTGGIDTGTFTGIGGDLCKYIAEFENKDQSGVDVLSTTHWGINIEVLATPAGETAGRGTPPVLGDTAAFRWKTHNGAGGNRWFNADIRAHAADKWVAFVDGSRGGKLKVDAFEWNNVGGTTYKAAVVLQNTEHTKVMPGSFFDCQGTANNVAVHVKSSNKYASVCDIDVVDYASTGGAVLIDNDFNSNYMISLVRGQAQATNTTGALITDNQVNEKAIVANNIDPNNTYILGDSDVDVNGLLTIPAQAENSGNLLRYQGTTTINGISGDRRGRDIKIKFTAICTINHSSGSVTSVEKIYLPSGVAINTTDHDVLHLCSDNQGWETVSFSAN